MAAVPAIQPFNSSTEDWSSWSRRFDQWLSISPYATGDDAAAVNAKKRAAFLTFIDSSSFKLLCSLCAPTKPEDDAQRETGQSIRRQEACTGGATPLLQLQTAGRSDIN